MNELVNIALKVAIIERGLTQRAFALELQARGTKISETRISEIVQGWRVPTKQQKQAIALALDRDVHDLFPVVAA